MNSRFVQWLAGLTIAVLINYSQVFAQDIEDPEAEYQNIRSIAIQGDLTTAASDARRLVNAFPSYGDARILLGRIIAWQKDYPAAIAVIDTLLAVEPDNIDALSARKDIMVWMKSNTPANTDIKAGYSFDYFKEPYSRFWQIFSAGSGHTFKWGKGSAGINFGYLSAGEPSPVKGTAVQFEAETYPKISKRNYAYIAYAFSPGNYFPGHRAAAELWQTLPAGWGVSAGINYFYFDRNIFIAGASAEKYIGNYWLSLKGYIYFKDEGPTFSEFLNARRYFNDTDYLQVTLGTGTAPDEPFDIQADLMRLSADAIRVAYNRKVTSSITLRAAAGYSIEEYTEAGWRSRYDANISLVYGFIRKREK